MIFHLGVPGFGVDGGHGIGVSGIWHRSSRTRTKAADPKHNTAKRRTWHRVHGHGCVIRTENIAGSGARTRRTCRSTMSARRLHDGIGNGELGVGGTPRHGDVAEGQRQHGDAHTATSSSSGLGRNGGRWPGGAQAREHGKEPAAWQGTTAAGATETSRWWWCFSARGGEDAGRRQGGRARARTRVGVGWRDRERRGRWWPEEARSWARSRRSREARWR